jgi:hypothetical protein
MKCYRLSTLLSMVNYVDNFRPVEKFGLPATPGWKPPFENAVYQELDMRQSIKPAVFPVWREVVN